MRRVLLPLLAAGLGLLLALFVSAPLPEATPLPYPGENAPLLRVPVSAAIEGRRSVENVEDLFSRAASVWAVCRIAPDLEGVAENSSQTARDPAGRVRALFVPRLGANGVADAPGLRVWLNDTTTVPPHRALAHELGHILGLGHTAESRDRLMFQGANGTLLTPGECGRARAAAGELFPVRGP